MGKHYTCDKFYQIHAIKFEHMENPDSASLWFHKNVWEAIQTSDIANKLPYALEYKNSQKQMNDVIKSSADNVNSINQFVVGWTQIQTLLKTNVITVNFNQSFCDYDSDFSAKNVIAALQNAYISVDRETLTNIEVHWSVAYRRPKHTIKRCSYARNGKHKVYETVYDEQFMNWGTYHVESRIVNASKFNLQNYYSEKFANKAA